MFEVSNELSSAVRNKNVRAVQDAIVTYLQLDPFNRSGNVDAAIQYALDNGIEVFSPHDDKVAMDMDQSHWTSEYTSHVATTLYRNFSRERIEHWKQVAAVASPKYDREHVQPKPTVPAANSSAGTGKNVSSHSEPDPILVAVGVAAAAVLIVGGLWWLSSL